MRPIFLRISSRSNGAVSCTLEPYEASILQYCDPFASFDPSIREDHVKRLPSAGMEADRRHNMSFKLDPCCLMGIEKVMVDLTVSDVELALQLSVSQFC